MIRRRKSRAGRARLRVVSDTTPSPRRRQKHAWRALERRDARRRWRRAAGLRLARLAVFAPVAVIILLRLAELVSAYATPTTGCRVTRVIDGDTVGLSCPGRSENRGRLVGFDTPEIFSPGCASEWRRGMVATAYLRSLIWSAGRIETRSKGVDRYGRLLIVLSLDGKDVAGPMVSSGHARVYHGGVRSGWCQ